MNVAGLPVSTKASHAKVRVASAPTGEQLHARSVRLTIQDHVTADGTYV